MAEQKSAQSAGLFDLRLIIAVLFAVYGVVLIVVGTAFTSDADLQKAAGININLWSGIGMAALAAVFALWVRLRPLVVPDEVPADNADGVGGH
ncbi:MAG TPA: hypothetical protein VGP03_11950 [Pseudonocardiaceae bacterium]|nr:hypothetical protein [Pseudonocardiaceae bacterium]